MGSDIQEIIKTVLTVLVFPFVVRWLNERRKGDFARRIATIAGDIAGSLYQAYPSWDEAKLIEEIAKALASQFPTLSKTVVKRVAASALTTAKGCK